ncbi:hypothetical protein HAX54_005197, partial [Datura stramonium]|nr:hypothetical protein [Datura stramonium]
MNLTLAPQHTIQPSSSSFLATLLEMNDRRLLFLLSHRQAPPPSSLLSTAQLSPSLPSSLFRRNKRCRRCSGEPQPPVALLAARPPENPPLPSRTVTPRLGG